MLRVRDDQRDRIQDHFPEEHIPDTRPCRKPVPARQILDAVLWILNTGAQWHLLPQCCPNYKTVHRRFQQWCHREVLREILPQLANTLRDEGAIDERKSVIDATFAAVRTPQARRTLLGVVAMAAQVPGSLGILRGQLPRVCATRIDHHAAETILR